MNCEGELLRKMNWDLFKLTPYHFLANLMGQGVVFSSDRVVSSKGTLSEIDEAALQSVKKHAEFFIDLAAQEYEFNITFKPSVIAIASIVCARRITIITPEWNS